MALFTEIIKPLRDILNDSFSRVVFGDIKELPGESIGIKFIESVAVNQSQLMEEREYRVEVTMFHRYPDTPARTEHIAKQIEKMRLLLLNNQINTHWNVGLWIGDIKQDGELTVFSLKMVRFYQIA